MPRYSQTKSILMEFEANSRLSVTRYLPAPGEYASLSSAANSFRAKIKAEHLPIAVRMINKRLYLIHLDRVQISPVSCSTCINRGNSLCADCDDYKFWKENLDETLA